MKHGIFWILFHHPSRWGNNAQNIWGFSFWILFLILHDEEIVSKIYVCFCHFGHCFIIFHNTRIVTKIYVVFFLKILLFSKIFLTQNLVNQDEICIEDYFFKLFFKKRNFPNFCRNSHINMYSHLKLFILYFNECDINYF